MSLELKECAGVLYRLDLEGRLAVSQDERRVLLERSLALENKMTKLLADNGGLTKKTIELEAALQEIAREYQVLQVGERTSRTQRSTLCPLDSSR